MLIATSTAASITCLPRQRANTRNGGPTMKFGVPVPSITAIDSIDQENFKAW
jgi:hypothetical protein